MHDNRARYQQYPGNSKYCNRKQTHSMNQGQGKEPQGGGEQGGFMSFLGNKIKDILTGDPVPPAQNGNPHNPGSNRNQY